MTCTRSRTLDHQYIVTPRDQAVHGARYQSQGVPGTSVSGGLVNWREDASGAIGLELTPRMRKGYSAARIELQEFRKMVDMKPVWPTPVVHLQWFVVH